MSPSLWGHQRVPLSEVINESFSLRSLSAPFRFPLPFQTVSQVFFVVLGYPGSFLPNPVPHYSCILHPHFRGQSLCFPWLLQVSSLPVTLLSTLTSRNSERNLNPKKNIITWNLARTSDSLNITGIWRGKQNSQSYNYVHYSHCVKFPHIIATSVCIRQRRTGKDRVVLFTEVFWIP